MSPHWALLILAWLAILMLALAMTGLIRQIRIMAAEGQRPGGYGGLSSRRVIRRLPKNVLDADRLGSSVVLFASRGCATCTKVLPAFQALAEANPSRSFVVVYPGRADLINDGRLRLVEGRADLFDLMQVPVTPYVISVDSDGAIGAAGPAGSEARLAQVLEKTGANGGPG